MSVAGGHQQRHTSEWSSSRSVARSDDEDIKRFEKALNKSLVFIYYLPADYSSSRVDYYKFESTRNTTSCAGVGY